MWASRRQWILTITVLLAGTAIALSGKAGAAPQQKWTARPTPATSQEAPPAPFSSFYTTTIAIPTYPYSPCLELRANGPYLYHWLDWDCYDATTPIPQQYTLLVMENEYLQVTVMPELGGRVYQMIFRPTGHNMLYQNPVVKPTHWGPPEQGWWLAVGGIEWCLPVVEHGYEWGEPWAWQAITSTRGVTVTVQDTWAADRLRATIELFLPAGQGLLAVTPRLENPTGSDLEYSFWINAALAPGPENRPTEGLAFVFAGDEMTVHSTGDCRLPGCWPTIPSGPDYRFSWPVENGIDFSRLRNWNEWLGFFEYPQAAGDFSGVHDGASGEGVARIFPAPLARGDKGFAFGWSNPIDWHEWTDDGSGYVELHGGVAPTFWDTAVLTAGATLSWTEYWYPIVGAGPFSAATAQAALTLEQDNEQLHLGVHSTTARGSNASTLYAWERTSCTLLGRWVLPAIDPANPFSALLSTAYPAEQISLAYLDPAGNLLAAVRPRDCLPPVAQVDPLPEWVDTTAFSVTWGGRDSWEGIAAYHVQVRDGEEGQWADWLTPTLDTAALFYGAHGHSYFFRARAQDAAGNWGTFGGGKWGDAFTTVLTEPAAVLITSRKAACDGVAEPAPCPLSPGRAVSYTLQIHNSGTWTATARLTDTPPGGLVLLTPTLSASAGLTPTYDGEAIHWRGDIPPGLDVRVSYTLSPTTGTVIGRPLTNTAEIAGGIEGEILRQESVLWVNRVWVPFFCRGW